MSKLCCPSCGEREKVRPVYEVYWSGRNEGVYCFVCKRFYGKEEVKRYRETGCRVGECMPRTCWDLVV